MLNTVPLLDILEESIRLLGGAFYASGSSVLPFLVNFLKQLDPDETDVGYIATFKAVLREDLWDR